MDQAQNEKLERFIKLLEGIFELDKADLDFGIYRIMNIRKSEIKRFLSDGLPKKVQEALKLSIADTETVKARIAEIEKQCDVVGVEVAKSKIAVEYSRLKSQLSTSVNEADVYSALYGFFNRYYDEGDFISKRRYKEGVYAIPYEGEEVKLYWANADQYYIKTTENFRDYTFISDGKKVNFRLMDATTERNNNKEVNGSKRTFMLYAENEDKPDVKTIEEINGELVIHFVYDIPEDKKKNYEEENYAAISDAIEKNFRSWSYLLGAEKEACSVLKKHLKTYVAKNTFDYFIHKDLRSFLTRELDFFIKSEVIHLDDFDTVDERRAESFLAKVRAIKCVGKIIIDFLAQIEDFQKKLWLKKKFVVETNWCFTLDRVNEIFYSNIIKNEAQVAEWREMYAIDGPWTANFLHQNKNLVLDTRHFSADFKEQLIASIDNLDEQTGGLLIHSENFQALRLLQEKYRGQVNNVHIDPPYNTDTNPFLYKNSYRHSSWASMMYDRIAYAYRLLENNGDFLTHIDENEYELLHHIFESFPVPSVGTMVWNKLNPMLGGKGIAIQHEYVLFHSFADGSILASNEAKAKLREYAETAISENGRINEQSRTAFAKLVAADKNFTGGDKAYKLLDDKGRIYRLVAMGAPEKRTNEKFYIPLTHPITGKLCPVPENGWSRTPETIEQLISQGMIVFGKDETTQPQKKVYLNGESRKQLSSVINDGTSGKATLDKLGYSFPYAHPLSLYELLLSANDPKIILDYFAGSGTTGHAVINLNRTDKDKGDRKYILVEMGEYFNTVTLPRMKKVIYSADWKDGKPQNRDTGVSHIMKYITLESYEDALSNITLDDKKHELLNLFGNDYMINYMLNTEAEGSLLNLDAFTTPFNYKLKINENNETKNKTIDLCETFNYLLGISVTRQSAVSHFSATPDPKGEYENAVKLEHNDKGDYSFKQIEGKLPDGKRVLVIWRTITKDLLQSNAALDAYFSKHRSNSTDRKFDIIYVNGDNNLENIKRNDENWKVQRIEPIFKAKMFEEAE